MVAPILLMLKYSIAYNLLNFPPILIKFVLKFIVCKVLYFKAQYLLRLHSPLTFMENQPLLWHLKACWTEGQMDEWINKQMEGNLDILDWYLTSYQILTKSIILLEKIWVL